MHLQSTDVKALDTLYADVEDFNIRRSEDSNVDSVMLRSGKFKQPDGSVKTELSIGVTEADFRHADVPVIDVLKFAFVHCPELVYQALMESRTSAIVRDITKEVDADFDMQTGP